MTFTAALTYRTGYGLQIIGIGLIAAVVVIYLVAVVLGSRRRIASEPRRQPSGVHILPPLPQGVWEAPGPLSGCCVVYDHQYRPYDWAVDLPSICPVGDR